MSCLDSEVGRNACSIADEGKRRRIKRTSIVDRGKRDTYKQTDK